MNKNIFREYDIRGVYPIDLNEDIYFDGRNTCVQANWPVPAERLG